MNINRCSYPFFLGGKHGNHCFSAFGCSPRGVTHGYGKHHRQEQGAMMEDAANIAGVTALLAVLVIVFTTGLSNRRGGKK